jgi:hypothetical protein
MFAGKNTGILTTFFRRKFILFYAYVRSAAMGQMICKSIMDRDGSSCHFHGLLRQVHRELQPIMGVTVNQLT